MLGLEDIDYELDEDDNKVYLSMEAVRYENLAGLLETPLSGFSLKVKAGSDAIRDPQTERLFNAYRNPLTPDFLHFERTDDVYKSYRSKGRKFHISLHDQVSLDGDNKNFERGWDIVVKHLIDANLKHFKIIAPWARETLRNNVQQQGKVITVYVYKDPELTTEQWEKLLTQMTQDFVKNSIIPGPLIQGQGEQQIAGCHFVSHRTDGVITNADNIYFGIKISVEGQLPNVDRVEKQVALDNHSYDATPGI